MTERWVRERRADAYWKKAKREGYRSRAAYKLKQMQARYGLFRRGSLVVDLGAAPGGWSQAALEIVGEKGAVIGVDLEKIRKLPPARFLVGDMTKKETLDEVRETLAEVRGSARGADAVVSDMSPNISGMYSVDQAKSVRLATKALGAARVLLRPGGNLCVKVFEGEDFARLLADVRRSFGFVKVHSPEASRSKSSEVYIVAKGFRPSGRDKRARNDEEE